MKMRCLFRENHRYLLEVIRRASTLPEAIVRRLFFFLAVFPLPFQTRLYTVPLHPRITPTLVSIPFRNLFHSSCPPHTLRVVHIRHHFFIFSHFLRRNTRSRHVLLTYFPSSFPHNTTPCTRSSLAAHLVYGHSAPTRRRRRRPRSSILTSY